MFVMFLWLCVCRIWVWPGDSKSVWVSSAPWWRAGSSAGWSFHLHSAVELQEFGLQQLSDSPLSLMSAVWSLQLRPEHGDTRPGSRKQKRRGHDDPRKMRQLDFSSKTWGQNFNWRGQTHFAWHFTSSRNFFCSAMRCSFLERCVSSSPTLCCAASIFWPWTNKLCLSVSTSFP